MSDSWEGPGWWFASDGHWYPPELWTAPQSGAAAPRFPPIANEPNAMPYAVSTRRPGTNGLALASLICSCAGILLIGIPSLVGIVFGFVTRSQNRRSDGAQRGDGLAMAGIVVGFLVVGLMVLGLVANAVRRGVAGIGG